MHNATARKKLKLCDVIWHGTRSILGARGWYWRGNLMGTKAERAWEYFDKTIMTGDYGLETLNLQRRLADKRRKK